MNPVFTEMQTAFAEAARAAPQELVEQNFSFARFDFRVRIIGHALANELTRMWTHLASPCCANSAYALELWDERISGIALPSAIEMQIGEPDAKMKMLGAGQFVQIFSENAFTCMNREARCIMGWRASAEKLSRMDRDKPLAEFLAIALMEHGVQILHAGAVARGENAVLLAGMGGSGKSTTALACLQAGFNFLGEDYVGLARENENFFCHSLYAIARLTPQHLANFPALERFAEPSHDLNNDKPLIFVSEAFPKLMRRAAAIRAIALPRVTTAAKPTVRPASRAEALRQLAPSSLVLMPRDQTQRGFDHLVKLVERTPAYWLELGCDLETLPNGVDEILKRAM